MQKKDTPQMFQFWPVIVCISYIRRNHSLAPLYSPQKKMKQINKFIESHTIAASRYISDHNAGGQRSLSFSSLKKNYENIVMLK